MYIRRDEAQEMTQGSMINYSMTPIDVLYKKITNTAYIYIYIYIYIKEFPSKNNTIFHLNRHQSMII